MDLQRTQAQTESPFNDLRMKPVARKAGGAGRHGSDHAAQADLALAEAVCARVCHDLASPLGALAGMLELAFETTGRKSETAEEALLAMELARLLAARLRLLRLAWGGGASGEAPDLHALLPALPGAERLILDTGAMGPALAPALRILAPGALIVAAAALPRGGRITLASDAKNLRIGLLGSRIAWPDALLEPSASLAPDSSAAGNARLVAGHLTCVQARALGVDLALSPPPAEPASQNSGQLIESTLLLSV